jgi:ribosomal protein S18 acetylase RimI-like enzyme
MTVRKATLADIDNVAELFNQYRQFYQQPADLVACRVFIEQRLTNHQSTIFVALKAGQAVGFTQLYDSFCSVELKPLVYLYDLFVTESARKMGVAKKLMECARLYGLEKNAGRLSLMTEIKNTKGQALYEQLGYLRDVEFYSYDLELN